MTKNVNAITFDDADPEALAAFWALAPRQQRKMSTFLRQVGGTITVRARPLQVC